MKEVLENMNSTPVGKSILTDLKLDKFGDYPQSLFYEIRRMANETRKGVSRPSPSSVN